MTVTCPAKLDLRHGAFSALYGPVQWSAAEASDNRRGQFPSEEIGKTAKGSGPNFILVRSIVAAFAN